MEFVRLISKLVVFFTSSYKKESLFVHFYCRTVTWRVGLRE